MFFGTKLPIRAFILQYDQTRRLGELEDDMKGIVAWFLGVPVIGIILLYYFGFF